MSYIDQKLARLEAAATRAQGLGDFKRVKRLRLAILKLLRLKNEAKSDG